MSARAGVAQRVSTAIVAAAFFVLALPRVAAAQDTHLLIITGVEGDAEHGELFHKWATTLIDAARKKDAIADANITYLADKPARDPARIRQRATRENVEKAFADLAARVRPNDELFVVLIGHGSFDGQQAAFNLSGPDLTAADYARLLAKFASQRVVFVNTTSSSGAFLAPLAGPGRTIVTATKTGGERNEPRFPAYLVEAFAGDVADKNRDGRVSVLEAFEYAKARVAEAYQKEGNILTEHATLDDGSDGKFATTLFLASERSRSAALSQISDPALRALVEQRQALEDRIAALKLRKETMAAEAYDQELEKLVIDLALKSREIQQREAKK